MKSYRILLPLLLLFTVACKSKKKENKEGFFPIVSFIKSQIAHIDTSLYSIVKVVSSDSLHHDTSYVKREDFRALTNDFLELPDLTQNEYAKRFTEEKMYDESLNRVIINYRPKDPEKEEIQKEQVLITPNIAQGDHVSNFIIEKVVSNKEGYLQKDLLWNVDQSFQVITTSQKPGQVEQSTILKVTWNEKEDQ